MAQLANWTTLNNSHIIKHFKAVIGVYVTQGFCVTIILADNQIESMQCDLANLHAMLHITSRDEHVPKVKRYNHTIKEHVRGNHAMLLFQHLPPVLIIKIVYCKISIIPTAIANTLVSCRCYFQGV